MNEETHLSRSEILQGNYIYPENLINLKPVHHLSDRLSERGVSLDCVPTVARVTKDNIHSAKTYDGKHLHSVVLALKYSDYKKLFIVINPFDGALKSMWFKYIALRYIKQRYGYRTHS